MKGVYIHYVKHCNVKSLLTFCKETDSQFRFDTKTDLFGTQYLILPYPDAYFHIKGPDGEIQQYFLEVFDNRAYPFKRVYLYTTYYKKNYWQYTTKTDFPEIIYVCPDQYTKKRICKFIQRKLTYDSPTRAPCPMGVGVGFACPK